MGIDRQQPNRAVTEPSLLTEDEAAALLRIQPATLATWRLRGRPHLPFVRVGRCIRYRLQDIASFIDGHRQQAPGGASS